MCVEDLRHLLIVRDNGTEKYDEYDFKSYKDKLHLLGCSDEKVFNATERFQKCRKRLVHEEAHFDDEIMTAQDEADNAHQLLVAIDALSMSQSS